MLAFSRLQSSLVRQSLFFSWIASVSVEDMEKKIVFESRNINEYVMVDLKSALPNPLSSPQY